MASSDGIDRAIEDLRALPPAEGRPPRLDRYDVGEPLGEGAASVVYRALDRDLNRQVAVKFLRESFGGDASLRERFLREARVTAGLSHPNIVAVHDVGAVAGGLYIVLELVDGRSLSELLEEGPGDPLAGAALVEKAARGVAAAHAQGIVHRDLKPANVLVASNGTPKVGDFGLAHVAGMEMGLTRSGAILGTPAYMAPEQVRGRAREVSARTDVYALGAILYEVVTGQPPHRAETVTELFGKIVGEEPERPLRRNPRLPRDLEHVILKALEKEPEARYATAAEFADDLARVLAGEPALGRPDRVRRVRRWIRRRPLILPVALGLPVLAILAWLAAGRRGSGAEPFLERGRHDLESAVRLLDRPEALPETVFRMAKQIRDLAGQALAIDDNHPGARDLLARAWRLEGRDDLAEPEWRKAVAADPRAGAPRFHLGRLLLEKAFLSIQAGSTDEGSWRRSRSDPLIAEATGLLEEARRLGFGTDLEQAVAASMSSFARGAAEESRRIAERALARLGDGAEGSADLLWVQSLSQPWEERRGLLERALRSRPNSFILRYSLGQGLLAQEKYEEAIAEFDRALRFNPRFALALMERGAAHDLNGDVTQARADLDRAIELDPTLGGARFNRGVLRGRQEDWKGALEDLEKAGELFGADWPGMTSLRPLIAEARRRAGR